MIIFYFLWCSCKVHHTYMNKSFHVLLTFPYNIFLINANVLFLQKDFFLKYDFELFFNLVCTLHEFCSFAVMWSSWVSCSLAATVACCCISRFYPQLLLFRMQRVSIPHNSLWNLNINRLITPKLFWLFYIYVLQCCLNVMPVCCIIKI